MKKILLILLLFVPIIGFSQVTTTPTIPIITADITVIVDATGTAFENYTGTVYTHTGATVNGTRWQNVIGTWGDNVAQPALTNTSGNIYELTITPDIYTYYGIDGADTITELNFVFRSADGNTQSEDVFIDVFEPGLNVVMTNPLDGAAFDINDMVTLSAESSINADLELFVNNVSQQTASSTTTISTSYTFTAAGNYTIKAEATQGSTESDEISVYVKAPTQTEPLPSGVINGFNDNGDGTVTFVLQAPNKTDVFLLGGFNSWVLDSNYQLKRDGDYFWTTVSGLDPDTEYAYQYYVDFDIKIADPYATKVLDPWNDQYISATTYPDLMAYPTGLTTGIVSTFKINETDYTWQNTSFTKPDQENLVIYEMLIRDFTQTDTYQDAMTHLDYLQDLGITAIELMPINEFEGNDSWGYNPSFHGALDKAYGTSNDFKEFVDECHNRGIAVILDVVYNHAFSQSPLAQLYWDSNKPAANNPWLNVDATHPYNVGYDFNHESSYTKTYVKQTLEYWVNEYRVDGFRFDLSKGFTQTNNPSDVGAWGAYDASRIAILKDYADHIWTNLSSDVYVILEHFADNSEETELANYGMMIWGNMNNNFNQNTMGYASNSDVSWLSYQNRGWNNPNIVGYMESHDEERLMVRNLAYGNSNGGYDITDLGTALDRQEAASAIYYGIPGPKMIWQFGELGYDKSINCDGDITDESCRLDRKPDAWSMGYHVAGLFPDRADLRLVTTKMISLKKQLASTFNTDNYVLDVTGLVKRINLYDNVGSEDVVIVANFDVTAQAVNPNFPTTGIWYDSFTGSSINVTNPTGNLSLNAGEYRLYSQNSGLNVPKIDLSDSISLNPNPANISFSINRTAEKIIIFDMSGRAIKTFKGSFTENVPYDISTLSNGIYFVKITTSEGSGTKRLIKN